MGIYLRWFSLVSVLILTVTLLRTPGLADDKARDRSTLKGIQTVVVIVHAVVPEWQAELAKVGMSESALQSAIENQLQKAGIQVTPVEASSRSEFEGILNVRLSFADPEPVKKQFPALDQKEDLIEKVDLKKPYVYAVRLNLRQLVSLRRDPSAEAFSITWQTESVGIRRLTLIQERIKSLVEVFIEAYTSENPNLINR
ncbi:MAG: hypothetical protein PVF09_11675 [Desulfobacterales bacterium]|jgi:hypothetical protein